MVKFTLCMAGGFVILEDLLIETIGEEEIVKLREKLQDNFGNEYSVFEPNSRKLQLFLTNVDKNYDYEQLVTSKQKNVLQQIK